MWNKSEVPGTSSSQAQEKIPGTPSSVPSIARATGSTARSLACLGATLIVRGEISGDEDLQIDGKVEGPVLLRNHRLTIGRSAQLNSEINAREVVVYGQATGNIRVRDRMEIKKDGEVIGDITTARISIEDGAYFKGRIEIERAKSPAREEEQNEEAEISASVAS